MSQERVLRTLAGLGLAKLDSQVYVFLAKKGPQRANEIAKNLKVRKQQLYPSLKSLQSKGIVSATLEHPARFSAISFEKVVDLFVKAKMDEAHQIEESKKELLASWQDVAIADSKDIAAKFNLIVGRGYIYSKLMQMIETAKTSILISSTVQELVRADQLGLFETAASLDSKEKICFRFLTQYSKQGFHLAEKIVDEIAKTGINFELKTPGANSGSCPLMVIRDKEEAIFFISSKPSEENVFEGDETCLWTNSISLVEAFSGFFEDLWRNSTTIFQEEFASQASDSNKMNKKKSKEAVSTLECVLQSNLHEPEVVGRKAELGLLSKFLDFAKSSKGSLVFVSGEAGSGKSRLVNEFLKGLLLKDQTNLVTGWCLCNVADPYFPFTQAFSTYFSNNAELSEKIILHRESARLLDFARNIENEKSETFTRQTLRDQIFAIYTRILKELAKEKPTIVFIEDLHWADSASLALLNYLARVISSERILIIGTYRSDELFPLSEGREHPLAEALRLLRRDDLYNEIKVPILRSDDVLKIVESMLRGVADQRFAEKLEEESLGNPLFVVESVRMLYDRGDLKKERGVWSCSKEDFGIPIKFQDILLLRLNRLNQGHRKVLDTASVIGEKFETELLSAVLGRSNFELLETLDIIGRSTSIVFPETRNYQFSHARSRDTIYQAIPVPLRREYHGKIAGILESRYLGEKLPASLLAYHFAQAGKPDQAIKYALSAAKSALSKYSNAEAVKHFKYSIAEMEKTAISEHGHELEVALEGLGDSYFGIAMFFDSIKTFEKLEQLSGSKSIKLRALRKATDAAFFLKDFGIMKRLLKKSEEFALADNLEYGRIQLNKGRCLEYDNMSALVENELKALKIFEEEYSLRDIGWALVGTGAGSAAMGNLEEGLDKMLRSAKLFEDLNDYNGQLAIYHQTGLSFFLQFGFKNEAIEMFSKVVGLCEKTGNHQRLAAVYAFWARILESEGKTEEALAKSLMAYQSAEKTDSIEMKALVLSNLVRQYSVFGDLKKAQNYFEELNRMPSKLLSFYFINVHLANAHLLAAKGEMPESRLCFEKSLRAVTPLSGLGWQAWTKLAYAQVLEKTGGKVEAIELSEEGKKTYNDIKRRFSNFKVVLNLASRREILAGKEFEIRIDMANVSRARGFLKAIDNMKTEFFEIKSHPSWVELKKEKLDLGKREILPLNVESIKLTFEAKTPGKFSLRPTILYFDESGQMKTAESNLLNLNVLPPVK